MTFKIDRRYVAISLIKAIGCYLIGLFLVLYLLGTKDPIEFFGESFSAFLFIYFAFFWPRKIIVEEGYISFVKENDCFRRKIKLDDIISVELNHKLYNTLIIITKMRDEYKLHPQNAHELERILTNRQS